MKGYFGYVALSPSRILPSHKPSPDAGSRRSQFPATFNSHCRGTAVAPLITSPMIITQVRTRIRLFKKSARFIGAHSILSMGQVLKPAMEMNLTVVTGTKTRDGTFTGNVAS